jgi:NAD+ synthase
MKKLLSLNPKKETKKIVSFLKKIQKKTKKEKVVLGLSGGIDSATTLTLLTKAYKKENIFVVYLPYQMPFFKSFDKTFQKIKKLLNQLKISEKNFFLIPLKKPANKLFDIAKNIDKKCFNFPNTDYTNKVRQGNILSRLRMIILFDIAKKLDALVCGTENKSENLLGYYTRFGDAASDIEPIAHLYKTEVFQLAKYLKVPKEIIEAQPTAGLWKNQTDEGEFGFSYKEADLLLYQLFDLKKPLNKIDKKAFPNLKKIISFIKKNQFKKQVPYFIQKESQPE